MHQVCIGEICPTQWFPASGTVVIYLDDDTESLYSIGKIVDGHGSDVEEAKQSYDPWWGGAIDPEWGREPTANEPGRSDTGPDAT